MQVGRNDTAETLGLDHGDTVDALVTAVGPVRTTCGGASGPSADVGLLPTPGVASSSAATPTGQGSVDGLVAAAPFVLTVRDLQRNEVKYRIKKHVPLRKLMDM